MWLPTQQKAMPFLKTQTKFMKKLNNKSSEQQEVTKVCAAEKIGIF